MKGTLAKVTAADRSVPATLRTLSEPTAVDPSVLAASEYQRVAGETSAAML